MPLEDTQAAAPAAAPTPAAAPAANELPTAAATPDAAASQSAASLLDNPAAAATQQPAPDGQTADPAAKGDAGTETKGDDAPKGAPEKYEFKPIDGVQLATEVVDKFSEVAKELNLPQEAAQKVLDKVAPVIAAQQLAAVEAVNTKWIADVKADKEIGGEKLEANLAVAKKARDAFGTPELRTLLQETRLGNNPEVIRFFYKVGQAISEDKFVPGGKNTPGAKPGATPTEAQAQRLYGDK